MTDATPITFTDNPMNPLEELLYTGLADPTQMGAFERIMLEADLYAVPEPDSPGGTPGDDGAKVLRPGEQLILRGVVLNDGRNTVTLFTDPARAVQMFGEDTRILAMQGRKLLEMLQDTVILLNPADGKGLMMEPDQIKAVLGHAPVRPLVRPSGRVELHAVEPENEPVVMTEALRDAFQPPWSRPSGSPAPSGPTSARSAGSPTSAATAPPTRSPPSSSAPSAASSSAPRLWTSRSASRAARTGSG